MISQLNKLLPIHPLNKHQRREYLIPKNDSYAYRISTYHLFEPIIFKSNLVGEDARTELPKPLCVTFPLLSIEFNGLSKQLILTKYMGIPIIDYGSTHKYYDIKVNYYSFKLNGVTYLLIVRYDEQGEEEAYGFFETYGLFPVPISEYELRLLTCGTHIFKFSKDGEYSFVEGITKTEIDYTNLICPRCSKPLDFVAAKSFYQFTDNTQEETIELPPRLVQVEGDTFKINTYQYLNTIFKHSKLKAEKSIIFNERFLEFYLRHKSDYAYPIIGKRYIEQIGGTMLTNFFVLNQVNNIIFQPAISYFFAEYKNKMYLYVTQMDAPFDDGIYSHWFTIGKKSLPMLYIPTQFKYGRCKYGHRTDTAARRCERCQARLSLVFDSGVHTRTDL